MALLPGTSNPLSLETRAPELKNTPKLENTPFWALSDGHNVTSRHRRNVTSQTPVVSLTTRLFQQVIYQMKENFKVCRKTFLRNSKLV